MRNLTPQPPSLQGKGEQEFPSPRSRSDRSFSEDEEGVRGEVLPGGKPSLTLALNEKPNPPAPFPPREGGARCSPLLVAGALVRKG
jgi:hypothetical protein